MEARTLSVFVDESGNFRFPDSESRFYIVGMVFHDQSVDISREIAVLERSDTEIGLQGHCFHAGPLIRREKNYSMLSPGGPRPVAAVRLAAPARPPQRDAAENRQRDESDKKDERDAPSAATCVA